jgi:hypothetical protein
MSSSVAADPPITDAALEDLIPLLGGDHSCVTPVAVRAMDYAERHTMEVGKVGARETLFAAMGEVLASVVVARIRQAKSLDDAILQAVQSLPRFARPHPAHSRSALFEAASEVVVALLRKDGGRDQYIEALLGLDAAIRGDGGMTPPISIRERPEPHRLPKLDWRSRRLATASLQEPRVEKETLEKRELLVRLRIHGFVRIAR